MNFGDPLLQQRTFTLPELEKEQEVMQQKIADMKKSYQQPSQPLTPVWDEIDRITSSLSDKEFDFLQNNQEFQESSIAIQQILQREYMRIMRPIVKTGRMPLTSILLS